MGIGYLIKKIINHSQIFIRFYRSIWVFSFLISLSCALTFYKFGLVSFTAIFWLKITSILLSYFSSKEYNKKKYFYTQRHNNGSMKPFADKAFNKRHAA